MAKFEQAAAEAGARFSGTVIKWDEKKGFGFIKPATGGVDVFVHHTQIIGNGRRKNLFDGEQVTFELGAGAEGKGPRALNVRRVSE